MRHINLFLLSPTKKKRLLLLFALSFLEIYGGLFKSKEDFPYKFNNFSTKKCNQKKWHDVSLCLQMHKISEEM